MADLVIEFMSPGRFLPHIHVSMLLTNSSLLMVKINTDCMQPRSCTFLMLLLDESFEEVHRCLLCG